MKRRNLINYLAIPKKFDMGIVDVEYLETIFSQDHLSVSYWNANLELRLMWFSIRIKWGNDV